MAENPPTPESSSPAEPAVEPISQLMSNQTGTSSDTSVPVEPTTQTSSPATSVSQPETPQPTPLSGPPLPPVISNSPHSPGPPEPHPPRWQSIRHWLLIGVPIVVLIVAAIAAYLIFHHRAPASSSAPTTQPGIDTTQLGPDAVKQLNDANAIAGSLQTLLIAPNTTFKNNVTIQGDTSLSRNLLVSGALTVQGASDLQGAVNIDNSLTVKGGLNVAGTTSLAGNLSVAGTITTGGSLNVGSLTASNITSTGTLSINGHIAVSGTTPHIQTDVASAGGSVSISGSDTAGTVTISTGSHPVAGELAIIGFATAYPGTPKVQLTPVSLTGASLQYFVSQSATFFTIETANTPAADTTYSFNYFVVQ